MKPVWQSKLYLKDGIHNGNCFAACLASLLEVPLWMVPPFDDMFGRGGEWRARTDEWLKRFFGMQLLRFDPGIDDEDEPAPVFPEFYIANGLSLRGVHHAVIHRSGKLYHDPHPSNSGIQSVEWISYLESVAK